MIEYHADPHNYILLACENGTIEIFKPSKNQIVASFYLEEAIKEDKLKDGYDEDYINDLFPQFGDIIELVKTIDVDQTNEYMVLS
jgi:hypothetical protein